MGLYTKYPEDIKEVDVIIAGGGAAGCIVAARLGEADANLSILLIEGGNNNEGNPIVEHPMLAMANMAPASKTNSFLQGVPEPQLGGRQMIVPSGAVLGGGSSTNFMMYSRASRSDFDSWDTPGWSADDLLPLMKKIESYHGPGDKGKHGYDGPIHVSEGTFRSIRAREDFITAAQKAGLPVLEDVQDLDSVGIQRGLSYIDLKGKRQDAASRYLHPKLKDGKHPNLHVLVQHQIVRVLFDGERKAVGVEFKANPLFQPDGSAAIHCVKARKQVVLSCGALGSPAVLERSGLGKAEVLQASGVDLVAELPNLGEGYQDHPSVMGPYKSSLSEEETLDRWMRGEVDSGEWIRNQAKYLGWNGLDGSCKSRPTSDAEVAYLGTKFQEAWDRDFKAKPDKPLALAALVCCFPTILGPDIVPGQYFTLSNFLTYPYSRGSVHITGPSLSDPLAFKTGFLSDQDGLDIKTLAWAYKHHREIARRMSNYRGEVVTWHPPFPAHSAAKLVSIDGPLPGDVKNIDYSAEDDVIIEKWVVDSVTTSWHSLGTCRMGRREEGGVVDGKLNVYSVKGLKVADLSIPPGNVGAHTNNTAMLVGEKAASILIEELGLCA